jgi:hypothetical protein
VLPIAEAIAFLMDRAGRSDETGARTLAEALGRLPLALDHAAAACKRTQMSFAAKSCADAKKWYVESRERLEGYVQEGQKKANAVVTKDGDWMISWDREALLPLVPGDVQRPAVTLSYVGPDSPYRRQIEQIADLGRKTVFASADPDLEEPTWAAYRAPGSDWTYFEDVDTGLPPGPVVAGETLRVVQDTDINVRPGPGGGGWRDPIGLLTPGEIVKVLKVALYETKDGDQEWIKFQRVEPVSASFSMDESETR